MFAAFQWEINKTTAITTRLMAIFQDNLGKLVPECLHSGFYWSKDDEDGGNSWNYQACKAPVKPSNHRHTSTQISKGRMSFLAVTEPMVSETRSTEGRNNLK